MLKQGLIPLSDAQSWHEILQDLPHGISHTRAYHEALRDSHGDAIFLYYAQGYKFLTACPLKIRTFKNHKDITTPYGLSGFTTRGSWNGFDREWQEFCRDQGWVCAYVVQSPEYETPFQDREFQPGRTYLNLILNQEPSELFKKFSTSHQYEIRRQENSFHLVTNQNNREVLMKELLKLYPETLKRTQANPLYHYTKESLKALFNLPGTLCLGASVNGEIQAISLFLIHGKKAEYFLNASTLEGRIYGKNLIWEAVRELNNQGIQTLNLGAGIQEGDSLETYKKRFGAEPLKASVYKMIIKEETYEHLCQGFQGSYFPLYQDPSHHKEFSCKV